MFSAKVLSRSNKNNTSSSPGTSDIANCGLQLSQWMTRPGPSPPKPLPRSSVPPIPRPRTLPPPRELHTHQLTTQLPSSPQNKGTEHFVKDQNCSSHLGQSLRWVTLKIAIHICKVPFSGLEMKFRNANEMSKK